MSNCTEYDHSFKKLNSQAELTECRMSMLLIDIGHLCSHEDKSIGVLMQLQKQVMAQHSEGLMASISTVVSAHLHKELTKMWQQHAQEASQLSLFFRKTIDGKGTQGECDDECAGDNKAGASVAATSKQELANIAATPPYPTQNNTADSASTGSESSETDCQDAAACPMTVSQEQLGFITGHKTRSSIETETCSVLQKRKGLAQKQANANCVGIAAQDSGQLAISACQLPELGDGESDGNNYPKARVMSSSVEEASLRKERFLAA